MPNKLQYESSLYLRQHAHNPVDWLPWGNEAFELARHTDRPVLLSIGYAACHWCHVMEKESFEDEQVAAFMNAHFICIKVDREERPDVDHLYMDALLAMTGSGGWPLNIFLTPLRMPFYGGTYYPPERRYGRMSWMELLSAIHLAWSERKEEIGLQADQLVAHLKQISEVSSNISAGAGLDREAVNRAVRSLLTQADTVNGGFGSAPKFPNTGAIRFLMEYYHFNSKRPDDDLATGAKNQVILSIDKMLEGGIYDQLGGGISRYATDRSWLVPHFEKMLYDNALFAGLLADAFRLTRNERYAGALRETIAFCARELRSDKHPGFFSALDADSEGEEGRFYTWNWAEWISEMKDAHPALARFYGIEKEGNWEGTNILWQAVPEEQILLQYGLGPQEWTTLKNSARAQLLAQRGKRVRPQTDDKILLSWNALMNKALVNAAGALEDKSYLEEAEAHMQWLLSTFRSADGGFFHVYAQERTYAEGNLDDYAYLLEALVVLASATGKERYIAEAMAIKEYISRYFFDVESRFFYFSSDRQDDILIRKTDTFDNVMPSANAVMMEQIRILGSLTEDTRLLEHAEHLLQTMAGNALHSPLSFSFWATYMQRYVQGNRQLIIAGPDAGRLTTQLAAQYMPECYHFIAKKETQLKALQGKYRDDQTLLYLCSGFSCLPPVSKITDLARYNDVI